MAAEAQSFDFIVVGSGAGGGVLASRLARNDKGLKVLLIDAGSDPRANKHYHVPAFHALATEDPELRWDYFVEHFSDRDLAHMDEKYAADKGIFYPRASAIGGCTAHHAMITVYPDPSDWDDIADTTRDETWRSDNMWRYFDRCRDGNAFGWLAIEATTVETVLSAARNTTVDEILLAAVAHAPHRPKAFCGGSSTVSTTSSVLPRNPSSIPTMVTASTETARACIGFLLAPRAAGATA